jgi:predicted nucleotide-binding protein
MHPEEVNARNALLKQESAIRSLITDTRRKSNFSAGIRRLEQWFTQTRRAVIEHISESEIGPFYLPKQTMADKRNPEVYFTSRAGEAEEALAALRQNLVSSGLSFYRPVPAIDENGRVVNEQCQAAHTAIRECLFSLIMIEQDYYSDEDSYTYALQRLLRWQKRTTEVLTEYVTLEESQDFSETMGELQNVRDDIDRGKAFLTALLEEIHARPHHFFGDHGKSRVGMTTRRGVSIKPQMFIGSSGEGLEIAQLVQLELERDIESTIWNQGPFGLSQGTLESLVKLKDQYDFAVLVLTPDDVVIKRGNQGNAARDNVIFELGLFMGSLGRERTFMLYCSDDRLELPSDLAGVTAATYKRPSGNNLQAALGPACTKIRIAVRAVNSTKA